MDCTITNGKHTLIAQTIEEGEEPHRYLQGLCPCGRVAVINDGELEAEVWGEMSQPASARASA